jgi:copper(I)-binding protein
MVIGEAVCRRAGCGRVAAFVVVLLAAALLWPVSPGFTAAAPIRIENAWLRPAASIGGTGTTAAYMDLMNTGPEADRLLGAVTDVAEKVEIHETTMVGGVMTMRPISSLALPSGATLTLKPGGLHLMLLGLKRDLTVGDRLTLTLRFEKVGPVGTEAVVRQP